VQPLGRKKKNWKYILIGIIIFLSGCAKNTVDKNNDLGSGDKSNLPVTLASLIEHAEYCKAIYDSGGEQKDEVAFEVKQDNGISIIVIRGTANEGNVLSDIDVRLVDDARTGIKLHKGFRDAAVTIMQIIDTSTKTGRGVPSNQLQYQPGTYCTRYRSQFRWSCCTDNRNVASQKR